MFRWARKILGRLSNAREDVAQVSDASTLPPVLGSPTGRDFGAVVLIAPRYDELTMAMEVWLREVEALLRTAGSNVIPLYGDEASPALLSRVIANHAENDLFVVFYGHGFEDALCTSPSAARERLRGLAEHGKLCSATDFGAAKQLAVAAFCCLAAVDLGRTLRRRSTPARFLGFTDYIDFVLEPAAQNAFARPMSRIIIESVALGELTRDAWRRLDEEYGMTSEEWSSGAMAGSDRSLLVGMFLDQHRELIDSSI